ncbi:MAG: hypothetical protein CL678_04605 [Bdellovibrionaceae bacterium]|nr:hypothetical protein [Pseudobdellovibrionaceae bacterium]
MTLATDKKHIADHTVKTTETAWKHYKPHRGFIGETQVDVSNYIFSHQKGISGWDGHFHATHWCEKIQSIDLKEYYQIGQKLTDFLRKRDMTFSKSTKSGKYEFFTVPVTPTIVPLPQSTYESLESGAQILLFCLRKIAQSIYGSTSIEASEFVQSLPEKTKKVFIDAVQTSPHYIEALHSPQMRDYPFFDTVGLDLVLVGDYLEKVKKLPDLIDSEALDHLPESPFRILEINAGSPSGASNNLHMIEALSESAPELLQSFQRVFPNDHFETLAQTYQSLGRFWTGKQDGITVLLPPGGKNGAAPEIHQLAAYSGLVYADPGQLYIGSQNNLRLKTLSGKDPVVTSVYSRVNSDSALFDPDKNVYMKDPESGEIVYLTDSLLSTKSKKAKRILDSTGKPIPMASAFAIPEAIDLIHQRRLYLGGLNRILDNKIILATLTQYAPFFYQKELQKEGYDLRSLTIRPPETLPPEIQSVETIQKAPDQWVIKAPDQSGGQGVYILKTLSEREKQKVIKKALKSPNTYAYQRLVNIARIPVAMKRTKKDPIHLANLAADIRMWAFYGAGEDFTKPKLTHNGLVRFAPEETGENSSIVNTSKGGGYAPLIVVDDLNHPQAVPTTELMKKSHAVPIQIDTPVFVGAQIYQVGYILKTIEKELSSENCLAERVLDLLESLKWQCREILSYLHPNQMEPVNHSIRLLEKLVSKKKIEKRTQEIQILKNQIISKLSQISSEATHETLDELYCLHNECLHSEEIEKDQNLLETKLKGSEVEVELYGILELLRYSPEIKRNDQYQVKKWMDEFKSLMRERFNSHKDPTYLQILDQASLEQEHTYDVLFYKRGDAKAITPFKETNSPIATLHELNTGELLFESNWVSNEIKSIRKEWLKVLEEAESIAIEKREHFIDLKREVHFKKFPQLREYQELIHKNDNTDINSILKILEIMPYAKFNLTRFAEKQGCSIDALFKDDLYPNKIAFLTEKKRNKLNIGNSHTAGECFAQKKNSSDYFSESEIHLWVNEELPLFSKIYTASHELIHFHQIEEMMRFEEQCIGKSRVSLAQFLNYYGQFLSVSTQVIEKHSNEKQSDRPTLYGLADQKLLEKKSPLLKELLDAYRLGTEAFKKVLKKYGGFLGFSVPASTSTRVKALREIIPAFENAKNILFAKELGLRVPFDEVQAALPIANAEQVERYRSLITSALKQPKLNLRALYVVANHQLPGVSFRYDPDKKNTFLVNPQATPVYLAQSYNSMQQ